MANNTSIKITIEAPALAEAILQLASALKGAGIPATLETVTELPAQPQQTPAPQQFEQFIPQQPVQPAPAPVQPTVTQMPYIPPAPAAVPQINAQPPVGQASVPMQQPVTPSAPAQAVTPEFKSKVFNAAAALTNQGKMQAVLDLLYKLGAQNASQLSDAQIPVFAAGIQKLGGVI